MDEVRRTVDARPMGPAPSVAMFQRLVGILAAIVVVSACAGGATKSPPSTDGLREIKVELTDGLRIRPDVLNVAAGETVRFVVTNAGSVDHEFFIGDEIAQESHGEEMAANGGRVEDSANGVGVKPRTREALVFTFAGAGSLIAGCHLPGHFGAGMRAAIAIGF